MEYISFNDINDFNNNVTFYSNGMESKLFRYNLDGKEILIKKYYIDNKRGINIPKIEKVNKLNIDGLITPDKLVKIGDEVVGFTMELKRGFYPLYQMKKELSYEQKYNIIMKLKDILAKLKENGCLYGDLNTKNIITNGRDVYLCDTVNIKTDNYQFDEISREMNNYKNLKKTYNGLDSYMLNLLTVYLFNDIDYDDVIPTIEEIVENIFYNKNFDNIVGVTDNDNILNTSVKIFLSKEICYNLLIDFIPNKEEIEEKTKIDY